MSAKPTQPGEVWRVDFGLAAKVRPTLVLSDYPELNLSYAPKRQLFLQSKLRAYDTDC